MNSEKDRITNQNKMKTATEWNQAIIDITMEIQKKFPELSKYIKEMPVKISGKDKEGIDSKSLMEYYNSLVKMVKEYSKSHQAN